MLLLNEYLRSRFGCKVYKLSLSADVTCPNRDGRLDTRGCIFCSAGGSGDFAADRHKPIAEQMEEAKARVSAKNRDGKYIAYFQSFTGTYAPVSYLRKIFTEAIQPEDIVALSVATRPDCLGPEVLALLSELNLTKPVWVELGLQTIHEGTARYIRRGYPLPVYDKAVRDLKEAGLEVIVHVILGLPGESAEDMLETMYDYGVFGLLMVIFLMMLIIGPLEEYTDLLCRVVKEIPDEMVIHRLTGDGPKKLLIAPAWSADKKKVLNTIHKALGITG